MKADFKYAKTHLAELITAASRGEIIEIDSVDVSARIIASPKTIASGGVVDSSAKCETASRAHLCGAWEGLVPVMSDEEWHALDKEIEAEMLDGPLFPPGYQ